MDIFTTVLTRVVPVPIKPTSLKVKALLKESETSKLKEDPNHLENHEYYHAEKQEGDETDQEKNQEAKPSEQPAETLDEKTTESDAKDEVKHLDLYV